MKKKFLNLQTILDRKDDFEVTDEKITLTDAEMQKIEDALAQKQKDLDDKSAELDKASQEVKDLKAKVEQKDKDIQDKDRRSKISRAHRVLIPMMTSHQRLTTLTLVKSTML